MAKTSDSTDTYFFEVGPLALAFARTPYSEPALDYVDAALTGRIDAIVPYEALYGAQIQLAGTYNLSEAEASYRAKNIIGADRIRWVSMTEADALAGFEKARELNVQGWDGWFAQMATCEGADVILTLDDDFDRVDGLRAENPLTPEQARELHVYIEAMTGRNRDGIEHDSEPN